MNINEWLEQSPKPEEIATNPDGSQYIPIGIVEQLLDDMTGGTWGTQDFRCTILDGFVFGSLLLVVRSEDKFQRSMIGAKTFHIDEYPDNHDWAAIALSECIKNAAKKLGNRFGRSLNGRTEQKSVTVKEAAKLKPDAKIMQRYMAALTTGNQQEIDKLSSMYDIKVG